MKHSLFRIGSALFCAGSLVTVCWGMSPYLGSSNTSRINFAIQSVSDKRGLPCRLSQRDVASVQYLLSLGVKVDSNADECINMEPSPRNVTLLMQSARRGETELVKFLLDNGASVQANDSYGDTPLFYAVFGKHVEIMELLIKRGAKVNARAEAERTPLMAACTRGDTAVVKSLLEHEADADAIDQNGSTALMFAAGYKQSEVMELLLKKGANPNLKDHKGRTASDYAKDGFPMEYVLVKM